jgi:hypothetical protein
MSCFGKTLKSLFLCQIGEVRIHQYDVKFLGYIIFGDGIHMGPCNIQTIVDWAALITIQNV